MAKLLLTIGVFLVWIVSLKTVYSIYQVNGPINIACLFPADDRYLFSIKKVRPAIEIAVEKIHHKGLLPGYRIEINYADSMCSSADAMNEAINFYVQNKSHVFFGPCCDYAGAPVARQTKYWKIPLLTTVLARYFAEEKKQTFPMMTRMGGSINKLAEFFAALLYEFNWRQLKIVYQPKGLDYIMDNMCHIVADSLHFSLLFDYNYLMPYYKFETTEEILEQDILQQQIGSNNATNRRACGMDRTTECCNVGTDTDEDNN